MSILDPRRTDPDRTERLDEDRADGAPPQAKRGHGGHGHWMMIACCIPMLVIAIALVATGVVGAGFIVVALMCTAMMALMMMGMSRGAGS
ncbi:MAG: hypothetical protein WD810_04760 [Solirubrobacterales bacterium]